MTVIDGGWYYQSFKAPNADITFAGLDSLAMDPSVDEVPARFRNGKWDINPIRDYVVDFGFGPAKHKIAYVSLDPEVNVGKAIVVIRNLKARKMCNVMIRESGDFEWYKDDSKIFIPLLVLCGDSIGDAGGSGNLPVDRRIHVD